MTVNLAGLLDRIHAVNQEIATVNSDLTLVCSRYYPNTKSVGTLPLIVPIVPRGQHGNTTYGSDQLHNNWAVPILLFVDNFTAGATTADAQANCEACIEHLLTEYWDRPRLELQTATNTQDAGSYADILTDSCLTTNSTIEVVNDSLALVRFTLQIETLFDIERI